MTTNQLTQIKYLGDVKHFIDHIDVIEVTDAAGEKWYYVEVNDAYGKTMVDFEFTNRGLAMLKAINLAMQDEFDIIEPWLDRLSDENREDLPPEYLR